jgi:hypothetical protein
MFSVAMVRLLKGVPLACLVALWVAQRDGMGPQGAEWLERCTGYSDKPVGQALLFLEEQGFVSRNGRYLWQVSGPVGQPPLSGGSVLVDGRGVGETPTPLSSSSSGIIDSSVTGEASRTRETENFRVDDGVLAALVAGGIGEPKRSALLRLQHVTVELVEGHLESAESVGQAIYRIEHNWPVGKVAARGDRSQYVSGEYSDFIRH